MQHHTYRIQAGAACTLALVSDLHNKNGNAAIRILERGKPDLIAVTGDVFLGYHSLLSREGAGDHVLDAQIYVMPFLEKCVQIAPTYLSFGNHEWVAGPSDLREIASAGVTVLDNTWVRDPATGLLVGGLSSAMYMDYRRFRKKYGPAARYPHERRHTDAVRLRPEEKWLKKYEAEEGCHVLLCHHPEYWSLHRPFLKKHRIELVLSGHAHGGQFRFFGRGLFAPGQGTLPEYTAGVHKGPYGRLVISRGLANTAPWPIPRLFNPPEVVFLKLT